MFGECPLLMDIDVKLLQNIVDFKLQDVLWCHERNKATKITNEHKRLAA